MSLRYRIAVLIVALEAVLIAALLGVILNQSLRDVRDHAADTERVWLQAVGDVSVAALATGDAAGLQAFIESTLRHPRITAVVIADSENRVVAATSRELVGKAAPAFEDGDDRYWRSIEIRDHDDRLGGVAIQFSDEALMLAYRQTRNLGLMIGLAGLLFTAVLGFGVGYVLTRRLKILADAADGINAGDMTVPFVISGTDEVSRLARAFDGMLRRLHESMAALTRARDMLVEPTEAMSQGFVLWDVNDRLVLCNTRFRMMFKEIDDHIAVGAGFDDLIARLHRSIVGVEGDAMTVRDWLARRRAGPAAAQFVVDVCFRSNRWIKVSESRTREGGRVAICTDITDDKIRQRALYASERRLREIMASVFDGIITIDGDGLIDSVNHAAQRMFRRSALDMLGRPIEQFLVAHSRAGNVPAKGLTSADLASSPMQALREIGGVRKGGEAFPIEISVARIELQGRSTLICTVRDITDRKAAEREILFHATHDALTGLPNRTLFDDRLTNALSHAKRSGETLALVFLDVDRFKVINDMLGHPIGDAVIIAVARRLLGQLRKSDTVARLGGDEFILLLRDVGNSRNAVTIGQGIVEAMRHPFQILGHDLHVTVSLGISAFPADGETPDQLRKHADVALYRAKSGGRNQLRLFTPEMAPSPGGR
ncbi:MAG: diguanylate cyclase [Rhodospirillales bacterium]|nr:diguanylate cyclase [Rhodospirillales bacterium]